MFHNGSTNQPHSANSTINTQIIEVNSFRKGDNIHRIKRKEDVLP